MRIKSKGTTRRREDGRASKCSTKERKKETKNSYEKSLLQILREKKTEDTDVKMTNAFYYHYSHPSGNPTTNKNL
jgi:hypothetical protein